MLTNLQAAKAPSTRRLYAIRLDRFPVSCEVDSFLSFLQFLLETGLTELTLRGYVMATTSDCRAMEVTQLILSNNHYVMPLDRLGIELLTLKTAFLLSVSLVMRAKIDMLKIRGRRLIYFSSIPNS